MNRKIFKIMGNLGLDKKDIDNAISRCKDSSAAPLDLYKAGTMYGTIAPEDL